MRKLLGPAALAIFSCLFTLTPNAYGQVATGIKPFNTYGGGPFDTVNLGNLNVHFDVPVVSKAGRGMSFTYALGYDSSVWYPVGSWQPIANWGWRGETEAAIGYVSFASSQEKCFTSGSNWYWATRYTNFQYHDKLGSTHSFALPNISVCPTYGVPYATATTTDGSGYQIQASTGSASIIDKAGHLFNPPVLSGSGPGTATDTNGNEITFNGTTFADTLGTAELTVSGTNPIDFTYTAPSGASAIFKVNYSVYTIRTNFGCSGISDYGPLQTSLVSSISLPDGSSYSLTYEATPGYSGDVTGRIGSITLPTGGTISYSYQGANNGITCADGSVATLIRTTPDGPWTYAHSESGTAWTTNVTDPQGNATVMNFQQTYETERQMYQGSTSGTLLKTHLTCYNGNGSNCNQTAVVAPITQKNVYLIWPGSSNLQSAVVNFYNSYGLVTEVDEYGYGAGVLGSIQRKTLTAYAGLGNDIQNRPASVTVEDGSGNIKAQTTYTYDQGAVTATSGTPQHVSISGSRGNATTVAYLVSGSTTLSKTYTYYDTGNLNTATDINGAVTTYSYGTGSCGNSFATTVSEPLNMSRSFAWNCTGGAQTSVTDENLQPTTVTYNDPYFWRENAVTDPLGNQTSFYYQPNPTYCCPTLVDRYMEFGSSIVSDLQYKDGLGRTYVDQRSQSPNSSTLDSVSYTYDANGRPSSVSLPCSIGYAGTCSTPKTTTTYDALDRRLQTTDGGGGYVSYSYSQNDTYRTRGPAPSGENAKRKQFEYDSLGRLTSVCEITSATGSGACGQTNGVTGYWTKYTYDVLNHLTGVTQNVQSSSQTRSYTYDGLGRMTSETNPESGTVTYQYDTSSICWGGSNGDLTVRTDNAGNVTCFNYDKLHRLTDTASWKNNTWYSGNGPCKRFRYDTSSNGVISPGTGWTLANLAGRLVEAETDICTAWPPTPITDEWFSYTPRGEKSDVYESTPHSSGYYHVTESFWANGVLHQLSNLVGLPTLTYGVDGEGRVYSVSASSGQNPLTSTSYNVASLPLQVNLGSSDSDSYTFDQNTNRMTQYKFNVNGQSVVGALTGNPSARWAVSRSRTRSTAPIARRAHTLTMI